MVDIQLGVLVGTVSLEVLSDRDGLLDEVVKVLGDGGGEAYLLVLILTNFLRRIPSFHPRASLSPHPVPAVLRGPFQVPSYLSSHMPLAADARPSPDIS